MAQKVYFLAPTLDYAPDTFIKLGQIISDPKFPNRPIGKPLDPLSESIQKAVKINWEDERTRSINGSVGIWASILGMIFGIGSDVALNIEREHTDSWRFERLETIFIEPDLKYIQDSMDVEAVKKFYEANPDESAFMVTGIKIARGASVARSRRRQVGGDGNIGLDGTALGIPVSAGPQLGFSSSTATSERFTGSSDFVFAYRLRQIYKRRKGNSLKSKDYIRGALYDLGSAEASTSVKAGEDPKPTATEFVVSDFDRHDFGFGGVPAGFEGFKVRDEVNIDEDDDWVMGLRLQDTS